MGLSIVPVDLADAAVSLATAASAGRAAGLREAADLIDALEPLDTSLIAAVAQIRTLAAAADTQEPR